MSTLLDDAERYCAESLDDAEAYITFCRTGPTCIDCGIHCMPESSLGAAYCHCYMVHDTVWSQAGMANGWICICCLESRLGRTLNGDDFPNLPINRPGEDDDHPRLAELKHAAAEAW